MHHRGPRSGDAACQLLGVQLGQRRGAFVSRLCVRLPTAFPARHQPVSSGVTCRVSRQVAAAPFPAPCLASCLALFPAIAQAARNRGSPVSPVRLRAFRMLGVPLAGGKTPRWSNTRRSLPRSLNRCLSMFSSKFCSETSPEFSRVFVPVFVSLSHFFLHFSLQISLQNSCNPPGTCTS